MGRNGDIRRGGSVDESPASLSHTSHHLVSITEGGGGKTEGVTQRICREDQEGGDGGIRC